MSKRKAFTAALAASGLAAGLALSACGSSGTSDSIHPPSASVIHTSWYDDTTSQYVVEYSASGPAVNLATPDGWISPQSTKPYLGQYSAICTFRFDNGQITWRVFDYSSDQYQSPQAQAECNSIGQMENESGG